MLYSIMMIDKNKYGLTEEEILALGEESLVIIRNAYEGLSSGEFSCSGYDENGMRGYNFDENSAHYYERGDHLTNDISITWNKVGDNIERVFEV